MKDKDLRKRMNNIRDSLRDISDEMNSLYCALSEEAAPTQLDGPENCSGEAPRPTGASTPLKCPECGSEAYKVLYCKNKDCRRFEHG
jgi:hypothetical protein